MEAYNDLREFMEADHQRLDALLDASEHTGAIDLEAYNQFKQGLLKHIAIEEKILFPLAQRLQGGLPLAQAKKLRLDHGALAAIVVAAPTPAIIRAIKIILATHNPLEEGPDGIYEQCKQLTYDDQKTILAELLAMKDVPLATRIESVKVREGIKHALARAGFNEDLIDE